LSKTDHPHPGVGISASGSALDLNIFVIIAGTGCVIAIFRIQAKLHKKWAIIRLSNRLFWMN
jgi:hypothetical protein